MLEVSSVKVLANPSDLGWVQVHEYEPTEHLKREKRGRLMAVICMRGLGKEGLGSIDQVRLGREVLTRIHEEYYGRLEGSAFEALGRALARVTEEFDEQRIEIGALSLLGELAYVSSVNGAVVMLLREGKLVRLVSTDLGGKKTGSGRVKSGDVFVVGTREFFEEIGEGVIKGALSSGNLGDFSDQLAAVVHANEKAGVLGGLGVKVSKGDKEMKMGMVERKHEPSVERPATGSGLHGAQGVAVKVIDKLLAMLPEKRGGVRVRSETVELRMKRKRKTAPLVGIILILILGVSIFFGFSEKKRRAKRAEYEGTLEQARHELTEARSLVDLDKSRARELVLMAYGRVNSLKEGGVDDEELMNLTGEIEMELGGIAGIYKSEANLFMDLSLISSGFVGDALSYSDGEMVVLDKSGRRVVGISLDTKKTEVIAGPQYLSDALDITNYVGRTFVLSEDGIREVDEDVELVIKPDWNPERVLMAAFAGNMYVLDKEESVIYRYPGVRLGFNERQDWLAEGTNVDLSGAVDWAIDGSIWVLREEGRVVRFSLGSPQSFNLSELSGTAKYNDVFTDEELEGLYLLDKEGKRIIVFDKNGEYLAEYGAEKLSGAESFIVSELERKIIFLAEDKLWEITLKHLN